MEVSVRRRSAFEIIVNYVHNDVASTRVLFIAPFRQPIAKPLIVRRKEIFVEYLEVESREPLFNRTRIS